MQAEAEKPGEKPIVEIQNVVASVILDQKIDLNMIVKNFENVEYKPDQFPGLVFRLEKPKTATLIFSSGKMVSTGAKSEKQAHEAVHKIVRELRNKKIIGKTKPQITVQNIVASATLPGKIDLEHAVTALERTMYEPEQFPGLIYRMHDPDVVILLFASGKLVCTGAVNEKMVYDAAEKLMQELIQKGLLIR
ncbi:MAG: TATA-box-binding protein [Candidatus Brockarchaeota archaeon]|nr:TATA-box-binding protein [Candidatus Brockarchaeota archaeon]